MGSKSEKPGVNKSKTPVPPGEGERRAQRGYVAQYQLSAAAIYAGLDRGDLLWIGLADRTVGIADDVVLGFINRIVGHQFKVSKFPDRFRLRTLLLGESGLFKPLAEAWQSLRQAHPNEPVEIRLVTNDYPSTTDDLGAEAAGHSAAFLREFELHSHRTLAEWRATSWQPFVDALCEASRFNEPSFEKFLQSFKLLHGEAANFVQSHRLPPQSARLVDDIAKLLPRLVADPRDKDRWTRAELLHELGWRDSANTLHVHRFPLGAHVQRNVETENALRKAIQDSINGYVSLVGPPGSGKSTLLQIALEAEPDLILVRYLAYVPGVGQGIGRGEADDFLGDLSTQLKRSGLLGVRFRDDTLHERREQFGVILQQAGDRFQRDKVRTLIVVDGLDHVPREERPQHSFLAELPLPAAIPEGVLFILGTQRLDLEGIKPAVQDQAGAHGRTIRVSALRREAVYRMADLFGLSPEISRDQVYELSHGHPLVTRYLIEALLDADARMQEELLAGAMTFEGDIETVYESAWRGIRDDEEAKGVLDYIARAEGPLPLELLAKAVSEQAINRALKSTKHLLSENSQGWSVFHNSFRLFICDKPRIRLGKKDPGYSMQVYRELASLARIAPTDSHQRWLELRYLARAKEHAAVLKLAIPSRFRLQLVEGRSLSEILADIRLAFEAAKEIYNPEVVFELLLASDEIERRWTTLEEAPSIVDALLAIGDIAGAQSFAEEVGSKGYEVVDALLEINEFERARTFFEKIEPLQQLLSGGLQSQDFHHNSTELNEWAQRVFYFRDIDQINQAIDRLSNTAVRPGLGNSLEANKQLAEELRLEVALAIMAARPESDIEEISRNFNVYAGGVAELYIQASFSAAELGLDALAMGLLRRSMADEGFPGLPNSWRRRSAIIATRFGDMEIAGLIFDSLTAPAVAELDGQTGDDASEHMARAVLEHSQLSSMLGCPVVAVPASKRGIMRPLQFYANAVGTLLGKAHVDATSVARGEVARLTRMALVYLEKARPSGSDEFYAMHQIAAATPVLGSALIQAAALCGEHEFVETVEEFDRAFTAPDCTNGRRDNLRRRVAEEIYRNNGDSEEASLRLEPMVEATMESTPGGQAANLAELAASFARVGNVTRAKKLLARIHDETLGYALPPKKDPQYAIWCDLLIHANEADPSRRAERVALLMRQVDGMMSTEGRNSAYRIASPLLTEACMLNAGTGLAIAHALVESGIIGWASFVDALLLGMVKRRPELVQVCVTTWCSLSLPYYMEPYYQESRLGEFVEAAISAATEEEIARLVDIFQSAIEAEARAHERAPLLEKLCTSAGKRGFECRSLNDALTRWKAESPPPRHSYTPMRHDELTSLAELKVRLSEGSEPDSLGFETAHAFNKLAPAAGFEQAKEMFERWPSIRKDSRARFVLINLAIGEGLTDEARRLMHDYWRETDDRATWTAWTGGSTLRYFQARVRLDGPTVHQEAYSNFVRALAAGQESITSVLHEFEDIFPTITQAPNWPAMWDCLAEQLANTREYALGKPFAVDIQEPPSDEEVIASVFAWAISLPLRELHWHVHVGILNLITAPCGAPIFSHLIRQLFAGQQDEPIEALQLLLSDTKNSLAQEFWDVVADLVGHLDIGVAESAIILSRRWGREVPRVQSELSPFYQLILESQEDDYDTPRIVDPNSGAMRIEDPLGWTDLFKDFIQMLARPGVSAQHIRHRCRMLIDRWGGLNEFGQPATDRLQDDLRRLDMRIPFIKPHVAVAARALRHVAGELSQAGMIKKRDIPFLLHRMGIAMPQLPVLTPTMRPCFVPRPLIDETSWNETEESWLQGVSEDVRPLMAERGTVVAEVCAVHILKSRRRYVHERMRIPFLDVGERKDLFEWFHSLPLAVWAGGNLVVDEMPAPTIVRQLSISYMPEIPQFQFTICPHWLHRLGWHSHRENRLVFIDRTGDVVARIVWWRDGGPVDIEDDAIWGEGVYLTVTSKGRAQIETIAGPLQVIVNARREYVPTTSGGLPQSRYAASRD